MSRLVHEAREAWERLPQEERQRLGPIHETLTRLEKRFREELDEGMGYQQSSSSFIKPAERLTAYYRYQSDGYSIFNNEGTNYYEGSNALIDLTMRAMIGGYVGLFAQPRLIYYEDRKDVRDIKGNEVENFDIDFQKCYSKLELRNFEIEYGKDSLWWGPSHHGALIMSNNAEPFEMLKLSNPFPAELPWLLQRLGLFKFNFIFTMLDKNRLDPVPSQNPMITEHDNPYLFGIHLDFKPSPWFEFGFNQISIYGGEGRKALSLTDHLRVMFENNNLTGKLSSNTETSIFWLSRWYRFSDFLPIAETLSFYGEWGGEDQGYPPDKRAFQLGLLFGDFLKCQGRLQLRLECADTSTYSNEGTTVWYNHSEYPATYEGRVFGHHMGSSARDFFARLNILLNPKLEIGLQGDYERRGIFLDTQEDATQGQIDIYYRYTDNFSVSGSLGMEHLKNADFISGSSDDRLFFSLKTQYWF